MLTLRRPFVLGILLPIIESERKHLSVFHDFPDKRVVFTSVRRRKALFLSSNGPPSQAAMSLQKRYFFVDGSVKKSPDPRRSQ